MPALLHQQAMQTMGQTKKKKKPPKQNRKNTQPKKPPNKPQKKPQGPMKKKKTQTQLFYSYLHFFIKQVAIHTAK